MRIKIGERGGEREGENGENKDGEGRKERVKGENKDGEMGGETE